MAKHRSYSVEFKRQVVQDYLPSTRRASRRSSGSLASWRSRTSF